MKAEIEREEEERKWRMEKEKEKRQMDRERQLVHEQIQQRAAMQGSQHYGRGLQGGIF
jgi:hypothetical protein